jgi:Domain of unknown function (DUF4062)
MTSPVRPLAIMISSPEDVATERRAAVEVIVQLGAADHIEKRFALRPLVHEAAVPPILGTDPHELVNEFLIRADECDVFVCILGHRMGTQLRDKATGETFDSGTEYELVQAYDGAVRNGKPIILVYRCTRPPDTPIDEDQSRRLASFLKKFAGPMPRFRGIHPRECRDTASFREMLRGDLEQIIAKRFPRPGVKEMALWLYRQRLRIGIALVLLGAGVLLGIRHVRALAARAEVHTAVERALADTGNDERWSEVASLARLGAPAIDPIFDYLRDERIHQVVQTPARSLLAALTTLRDERPAVCKRLETVLDLDHPAFKYPKSLHRNVIDVLVELECPGRGRLLCGYVGKITLERALRVMRGPVDYVDDLVRGAERALGATETHRCRQGGVP